jgi:hypothetical protein
LLQLSLLVNNSRDYPDDNLNDNQDDKIGWQRQITTQMMTTQMTTQITTQMTTQMTTLMTTLDGNLDKNLNDKQMTTLDEIPNDNRDEHPDDSER